jgi:hypothetical protein
MVDADQVPDRVCRLEQRILAEASTLSSSGAPIHLFDYCPPRATQLTLFERPFLNSTMSRKCG